MAIHRSSDSLSRCDSNQYSSIYDVRKRPDVKSDTALATGPAHKDTIEISRDKLKEEALSRLRHTTQYGIAHNGFMRIGKYLFLAVAMPPYFLIYGLPKWILGEAIPLVFSFSVQMMKKLQSQCQKGMEKINRKVVQMARFVQKLAQVLMQPFVQIALHIRQTYKRLQQMTAYVFKNIAQRIKATLTLPIFNFTRSQHLKRLKRPLQEMKEKFSQGKEKIAINLQSAVEWIKKTRDIFFAWGQLQFQRLAKHSLNFNKTCKSAFQPSHKIAEKATHWVFSQFKKGVEILKKPFIPIIHFYQKQWLSICKTFARSCKTKGEHARGFFQEGHRRALGFLQSAQEKIKCLSIEKFLNSLMSSGWLARLPGFLQAFLRKWLSHSVFRKALGSLIKGSLLFTRALLSTLKFGLEVLFRSSDAVKKMSQSCRKGIRVSVKGAVEILKVSAKVAKKSLFYALYYTLLFFTMLFILIGWGIRLLSESTSQFISKFFLYNPIARQ